MATRIIDNRKLTFGQESDIRPSFRLLTATEDRRLQPLQILMLEYSGPYAVGSAGRRDAAYLLAMSRAAVTLWPGDALIFDLRELHYVWGDEISALFDIRRLVGFELPSAVIASPVNETPLRGIIGSEVGVPACEIVRKPDDAIVAVCVQFRGDQ